MSEFKKLLQKERGYDYSGETWKKVFNGQASFGTPSEARGSCGSFTTGLRKVHRIIIDQVTDPGNTYAA